MGYVYLIEDIDNMCYKIGATKNVERRLNTLQTGNCAKLVLIHSFECEYPFRLEKMLHNYYKKYNVLNEWFYLDNPYEFIDKCKEFSNTINILKDNPFFNKNLK